MGTSPQRSDLAIEHKDPFDASWRERVAVLVPTYGFLVLALVLGLAFAPAATAELLGLIPVSFFAAGKFLPLWAASGKSHFGPYELGAVIWILDTFTVLNIVYALEAFYRIGPLKRGLDRVQGNARLVLRAYPKFRRGALVGVVLFVLFPVAGTGAIGGTFIGILLGMRRGVLIAAVSLGGFIGGGLMAFAAVHFEGYVVALRDAQRDPTTKYLLIAIAVFVLVGLLWWVNRAYQGALERVKLEDES